MVYIVVGRQETYQCSPEYALNYIQSPDYRLYGAADTVEDAEWLYRDAQEHEWEEWA